MAITDSLAELFESAFDIARASKSYPSGIKAFYQSHSSYPRSELREVWDKVYERSQRVAYMEDSNQSYFISKSKLGCPEGGNILFYTFMITFSDDNGNQHEQHYHVKVPIERQIGQTNQEAFNELVIQLRDRYFTGMALDEVQTKITSNKMKQVKCMTGGD